jgi:hypothetical protein
MIKWIPLMAQLFVNIPELSKKCGKFTWFNSLAGDQCRRLDLRDAEKYLLLNDYSKGHLF